MLKRFFFILFCTSLCATAETESSRLSKIQNAFFDAIRIGAAAYIVYTVIPKIEGLDGPFGKSIAAVAGVAIGMYGACTLYTVAEDLRKHGFPSAEKKARIDEARKKNELFTAKQEFRSCLIKNLKSEKNASGLPTACEELASTFAMIAGKSELDEITSVFNNLYRKEL